MVKYVKIVDLKVIEKSNDNTFDLEIVEKFNPYHDKLGRFTTAGGATVFTWRTKDSSKQWMANRAIEREKERTTALEQQQQQQKPKPKRTKKPKADKPKADKPKEVKDPDKIGWRMRGEPMSHELANSGNVNPNFLSDSTYRTNCQTCVVAYEARLRGFNVTARPRMMNGHMDELAKATHRAWLDPATGKEIEQPPRLEGVKNAKALVKRVQETVKPGERYNLVWRWKNRNSGHIVAIETDKNGDVFMYDPQNGKKTAYADFENYFKQFQYIKQSQNVAPRLYRVDNLILNPEYANAILK